MIRVGLLGLGGIGKRHYEVAYSDSSSGISLDACFDIVEENMRDVSCARKYTSLDEFFVAEQGKLDFIDICLPTFLHKDTAIQAMCRGFNVLCEKPMALSSADGEEMLAVSRETGKKLMIAQPLRFNDDFRLMREYVKSEKLGKLRNVRYTFCGTGLPVGQNGWFKNEALSGGPILDIHVHGMDFLIWTLGMPRSLFCTGRSSEEWEISSTSGTLIYDGGLFVNTVNDWFYPKVKHELSRNIRLNFDRGYIIYDLDKFVAVDIDGNETNLKNENPPNSFKTEIEYFASCIASGEPCDVCPVEESIRVLKVIEAEIASVRRGGAIHTFGNNE